MADADRLTDAIDIWWNNNAGELDACDTCPHLDRHTEYDPVSERVGGMAPARPEVVRICAASLRECPALPDLMREVAGELERPLSSRRNELSTMITGSEVKHAVLAAKITEVLHHECAFCDEWVKYTINNEQLYFEPACGCGWAPPEPRSWDSAAEWINMQTNEKVREKIMARFGLNEGVS